MLVLSNVLQHMIIIRAVVVLVCVVRKWDFQGMLDNRSVQHVDMVLTDEEVWFSSTLLYLCMKTIYGKGRCSFHCVVSFPFHSCFTQQFF
jgi:hypothetical protein